MTIKTVALIGAGAVGAYFIWGLSNKLGDDFCVVAKEEKKESLIKYGVVINGESYYPLVKEPEEAGVVDLILVACKYNALSRAIEDIIPMVGEHTIVMSLLNGIRSEEIIGERIGMEHMVYSTMRIAAHRFANTVTFSPKITKGLFVGEKGSIKPTERILAIKELFKGTGVRYNFSKDIIEEMWLKYAGNVSQNLPQAILGLGYGAYSDSEHLHYVAERLWKEVAMVAKAKGVIISEELILFGGSKQSAVFSTLQDLRSGRVTEIECFAGDMIRMGKECGVEVPFCECVYHMIKTLEERMEGKFAYYD